MVGALVMASCTASLYPIVAEDNVVYKPELLGSWKSDGTAIQVDQYLASKFRSVSFGETDSLLHPVTAMQKRAKAYAEKSYLITYEEKGTTFVYESRLTSIGGKLFAELLPYTLSPASEDDPYGNYERGHAIARVDISGNKLSLTFLDGGKIKSLVLQGKLKIRYEHEKLFDLFIITADTKELRQFLTKYGNDERLFNKSDGIILTR